MYIWQKYILRTCYGNLGIDSIYPGSPVFCGEKGERGIRSWTNCSQGMLPYKILNLGCWKFWWLSSRSLIWRWHSNHCSSVCYWLVHVHQLQRGYLGESPALGLHSVGAHFPDGEGQGPCLSSGHPPPGNVQHHTGVGVGGGNVDELATGGHAP